MADEEAQAVLRAEIERLQAELDRARLQIADLELRADSDPLTGLRNRLGFEREMKRSLSYIARYGGSAVLAFFDLDRFKAINDSHGHAAGDMVLRGVADLLSASLRASDIAARLGGDEFAALMWNIDMPSAQAKVEQLEAAVAAARFPYALPDRPAVSLQIGMSGGIAALEPGEDFSKILEVADRAMYGRKLRGLGHSLRAALKL